MSSNTTGTAVAAEPFLTAAERELAHRYLQQTHHGIVGAIKGLSGDQWKFRPAPDQWSIAEVAEHVIFVNELILGPGREKLRNAPAPPFDRDLKFVDSIILGQFPSRLAKFSAPAMSHPVGRCASPAEALDLLGKTYAELDEYVESTDLRQHATEAPPIKAITNGAYDTLDGYQWILAVAAHCERHTKQMLEVRADPAFPAA